MPPRGKTSFGVTERPFHRDLSQVVEHRANDGFTTTAGECYTIVVGFEVQSEIPVQTWPGCVGVNHKR